MKTLFILLIVILFAVSSYKINAACENISCDSVFTEESVDIALPQFPGCTVIFFYRWRVCSDTIEITFHGFVHPDTTAPCLALLDSLKDANGNPNWDYFDVLMEYARLELVKINFMAQYNAADPYDKHLYQCPNGRKYYTYLWKTCQKWVSKYGEVTIGEYTLTLWYFEIEDCGGTICCEEQIDVCFNTTTQQLDISRQLTSHVSGECPEIEPTETESSCSSPCNSIYVIEE